MATRVAADSKSPPDDAQSVSELTARVKEQLETRFADVWVTGEVSNLTRASSGHVYLSLKDDAAVLRAVIWRGAMQGLALEPTDGLEVICHGRLEVYAPRGTYQLTIDRLHAVGTGALEAQLRRLHAKLEAEGAFAAARKRPLPPFPQRIAVVTSPTGAAIADFLKTLLSRWQASEVIVVPSRVQGAGAAEELAAALGVAARLRPAVDVIALVRGGGSLEDLWSFNEEVLVRAVATSPVPVVSGVGHEIDVSLCDLAADVRALTPTDAAVKIVPDGRQVAATVGTLGLRLDAGLSRRLEMARERVVSLARSRIFADPNRLVRDRRDALDQHARRLRRLAGLAVDRGRERLAAAAARLEAGSPLHLLARGWSLTSTERDAATLRSVVGLAPGDTLVTQLADGRIWSTVERISNDDVRT
ncbi:MAG: exodeoxyribonuclease VII large subunit [Planctomycetia bacterium]|nr:exodeoxyribonuclease VII large subunit [Planctomycetia bacterium]